jgi:hypothetical protein
MIQKKLVVTTPLAKPLKTKKPSKNNYVDKVEMTNELRSYKKTGVMSEKLGKMFLDIANNYLRSQSCFHNYTELDDFIGDSILRMVSQAEKFDTERKNSNPYFYFTLVAHRRTIAAIKQYNRGLNFKKAMADSLNAELYDNTNTIKH